MGYALPAKSWLSSTTGMMNAITLTTEAGRNYYVQQHIKLGVFSGGANLRQHDEASGQREIRKLEMARSGSCSGAR